LDNNKLKTLPKEIIKLRNISIVANRNPNLTIPYILKNKNITVFHHYKSFDPNVFYEKKYNYSNYYKNQLSGINKRKHLPFLPKNIKNLIAKKISNVEPVTKPLSKTKNPLSKIIEKIKLKRNTKNIEKVTTRIKSSIKTPKTPKINNKPKTPNTPKTIRKKAGNAAQSRRTNRNNIR